MSTESKQVTAVEIRPPNLLVMPVQITGTAPYVQNCFSNKMREIMEQQQRDGKIGKSKKVRTAKDFDALYNEAMYHSREGWHGIPAAAFRNAMISACRTVGYKMTHAKLAAFVLADGYDLNDGTALVRLYGEPHKHTAHVRNANGSTDIRIRPMWDEWNAVVRVRFDADMLKAEDVVNLMMRVGMQVGVGEGRPDSKSSAGMGWGLFTIDSESQRDARAA